MSSPFPHHFPSRQSPLLVILNLYGQVPTLFLETPIQSVDAQLPANLHYSVFQNEYVC